MSPFLLSSLYALCSSFLWALFNHLIRQGLRDSSPRMAVWVPTLVMPAILGVWASLMPPGELINLRGVLWLVLAGVVAPGLLRPFYVLSLDHLGVARVVPIINCYPFVAAVFAVLLMGERPGLSVILSMVAIVTGVILITARGRSEGWQRRHLVYPVGSAMIIAVATILRKAGMIYLPHPVFGAFITSLSGLPCIFLLMPRLLRGSRTGVTWHGGACFVAAGALNCLAFYFIFQALRVGDITVVAPLMATPPLFNLLLSYLFLRSVEPFTWRVVGGTLLTVLGTVAMLIFQGR